MQEWEIKATAYADDMVGYKLDDESTQHFFNEFENQSRISEALINRDKTQIIKINQEGNIINKDKVKILGILFDCDRIGKLNYENVKNKITQAIEIWKRVKHNMVDRIVVCKTFLLSNYGSYVRNNAIELVKRDTMIILWERGGLGMFHLTAKLDCIAVQQFIYVSKSIERKFYCMSVYWLKFILREMNLTNFNIIQSGLDRDRPDWCSKMYAIVSLMKKSNKNFMSQRFSLTSKVLYEKFRAKFEKRANCENDRLILIQEEVYGKTLNNKLDSSSRTFNFKILNDGLEFNMKFKNRKNIKCFLCCNQREHIDRLLISCQKTTNLFKLIESKFENKVKLNILTIIYHLNLTARDSMLVSIFKLSVWLLRNKIRVSTTNDYESVVLKFDYKIKREMWMIDP